MTSPDASKSLLSPVEQERFVEDNYLKMDMFSRDADARNADAFNSRSSISAKFLTRTSQRRPPPIPTKSVAFTLLCFYLHSVNSLFKLSSLAGRISKSRRYAFGVHRFYFLSRFEYIDK